MRIIAAHSKGSDRLLRLIVIDLQRTAQQAYHHPASEFFTIPPLAWQHQFYNLLIFKDIIILGTFTAKS